MRATSLLQASIAGQWVNGWLYKDQLLLWDRRGALFHTPLSSLVRRIGTDYDEDVAFSAQVALFRNDWKSGLQTAAFSRSTRMREAMREVIVQAEKVGTIELPADLLREAHIDRVPGLVLAVSIYGNHTFIGSSEGLFETNVNPEYLNGRIDMTQRLSSATHDIETNYGAIAASGFEEGLWFDEIDFGEGASWLYPHPMRQIGEFSAGVSMASTNLLNFTDSNSPDLYLGMLERRQQSARANFTTLAVTGYNRSDADIARLAARSLRLEDYQPERGDVRLLSNSRHRFLYDVQGSLRVLRLLTGSEIKLDKPVKLPARVEEVTGGERLESTHPLGEGFLMETFDQISWVGHHGVIRVTATPAVAVRTFPVSRHFQEVALIIEDERALLVGMLDFPRA